MNDEPFDFIYSSKDTPIRWWTTCEDQHEHLQTLAIKLFAIVPSQAFCECNFSTLKWLYGQQRTCLDTERLESMAKIYMYYISKIRKELQFYGKDLTDEQLHTSALAETTYAEMDNVDELFLFDTSETNTPTSQATNLLIEDIINLTIISDFHEVQEDNRLQNSVNISNMNFNPEDLVNSLLNE